MGFKLYEALGLDKNASPADIKKAYKRAAMKSHPDKGGDPEQFKEIGRAYEVLGDDQKRALYDQLGDEGYAAHAAGGGGQPFNPFEQMFGGAAAFEHMFGGAPTGFSPINKRGGDHLHTINIPLSEAFTGSTKSLKISLKRPCRECMKECGICQGRGMIQNMIQRGFMTQIVTQRCSACDGQGKRATGCGACSGAGIIIEEKGLDIVIPRGVANGHRYIFEGYGDSGDPPGNLIVQIAVQSADGIFMRSGALDLVYTAEIDFIESITGKKIKIPHYSGEIEYTALGIIAPHTVDAIPGKGLTEGGKLEIRYNIRYPTRGSVEEVFAALLSKEGGVAASHV